MKTPVCDMLNKYASSNAVRLHMPGHKGKFDGCREDITELSFTDNLRVPSGVILQSQKLYADVIGCKYCLYGVNGSTGGLFALAENCRGKVLVESNCHVSLLNGLKLYGKESVTVRNGDNNGIPMPLTLQQISETLEIHPDIGTVFITSPNYFGFNAQLKEIYRFLRKKNILLFVDSAHGAHFGLHKLLPDNAVKYCDATVESCHKTLPAMTQTAVVLTNNGKLADSLKQSLNKVTTTSPSFVLVASIEKAIAYADEHKGDYVLFKKERDRFVQNCKFIGWKVISNDDFTRLVIDCDGHGDGNDVEKYLEKQNIFIEYSTPRYLVCILTLMDNGMVFDRLFTALKQYVSSGGKSSAGYVDMCFPNK